jgi:subtilisin-like proprotein convertase family protein/subtilisin family serine protease
MKIRLGVAVLIACIAGCGGGGSGGGGPTSPLFTVGGTVSGLAGGVAGTGLVLQLNGGGNLGISANGPFHFPAPLVVGTSYNVTVFAQSASQTCSVTGGGSGTVGPVNVTSVAVSCTLGFTIADSGPLASEEWHLKNTGQDAFADTGGISGTDINVEPVYLTGSSGAGQVVAVVDSGMEIAHEDLAANVIPGGSWNFNNGTTDPTSTATAGDHGTSVAGLIAMARNAVGGIGVAPSARLKGFNFLSSTQTEAQFLDSIGGSDANPNSSGVAIFNQSFGINTVSPIKIDPTEEAQYATGVNMLRAGSGALYVKAAGNGFLAYDDGGTHQPASCNAAINLYNFVDGTFTGLSCENANFDPANAIPYQIVVGAINASRVRATYSSSGSAIWVSAPGGEFGRNRALAPFFIDDVYTPAMITTDQSGCNKGFATNTVASPGGNGSTFDNGGAPNTNCNYTNGFNGTSSATPVTAGVIALMLEANPALQWRDVKDVLARTATPIDTSRAPVTIALSGGTYTAEPGWTTNAAGFNFHNWYGFGLVNASAAVTLGVSTTPLPAFQTPAAISSGTLNIAIPDFDLAGASSVLNVPVSNPVHFIEAVQISVDATHPSAGDLGIELISPSGTRSVLKNIRDGFTGSADLNGTVFLSNAFYGEDASAGTGDWTIKVVDGAVGNIGTLTGWTLRVYGH